MSAAGIDELRRRGRPRRRAPTRRWCSCATSAARWPGAPAGRRRAGDAARRGQLLALGVAPDAEAARAVGATLSAIKEAVAPYRVGDYPNFVEDPADASAFFDAAHLALLREVKALYDPSDLFKANHPIPPSAELG